MRVQSIIIIMMILQFNFLLLSRHWCSLKKKKNGLWIKDKLRGTARLKKRKKTNAEWKANVSSIRFQLCGTW